MPKIGDNIYKRKDGRWEGRYVKGRTIDNKIIYGYTYGQCYDEVKQNLKQLREALHSPPKPLLPYRGNYESWVEQWMILTIRIKVKEITYTNYSKLFRNHILPALGEYTLEELQPLVLQRFIEGLVDKGLAMGSIRVIVALLKQSLNHAVKENHLKENPCVGLQIPTAVNA